MVFNFPEPKRGRASVLPNPFVITAGSETVAEAAPAIATTTAPEAAAAAPGAAQCEPEIVAADDPDDGSLGRAICLIFFINSSLHPTSAAAVHTQYLYTHTHST